MSSILPSVVPTSGNKPYRVYRQPRRSRGDGSIAWDADSRGRRTSPGSGRRRKSRLRRPFALLMVVLVGAATAWGAIAYAAFHEAVEERNALVPKEVQEVLAPTDGPLLTSPRNILLIGTDSRANTQDGLGRADSLILMRADIPNRRFAMLSIPRDLRAEIPQGFGSEKINSAYSLGGAPLTIQSVRQLTGVPIHHYIVLDFDGFRELIDAIDGITVNNPKPILSTPFDGREWRFYKGEQHLNGRRALAYARVRTNQLDPNESDLTRAARQQRVLDAIGDKVVSTYTLRHPQSTPRAVVQPLTTEITAPQLIGIGLSRVWASPSSRLHCRLGGEIEFINGSSYIVGDGGENRAVVRMFLGQQPALQPNVKVNQFAGGCLR